jgi:hypothetical protein
MAPLGLTETSEGGLTVAAGVQEAWAAAAAGGRVRAQPRIPQSGCEIVGCGR